MSNKRINDLPITTIIADTDKFAIDGASSRSIEKQDLGFAEQDLSNVDVQDIADKGIAKDDFSNVDLDLRIPEATETVRGTVSRATQTEAGAGADETKYISSKTLNGVLTATGVSGGILPRKFISGLVPNYLSTSILEIPEGACRDNSNTLNINLISAFRKTLTQDWTSGQGNLGLARNRDITGFYASTGTTVNGAGTLFQSEVKVGDVMFSVLNTESRRIIQTDFDMTGTITTNLTNVVGSGTLFTTETAIGEYLLVNDEARKISNIINNTSLVLETAFSVDYTVGEDFQRKSDTEIIIDETFTVDVTSDRMTLGGKRKNSTYHLFLLTDGLGNVDAGYDFDVNAVNLLADSSVVSAGFNRYRRVGSFKLNDSAEIREFTSSELAGGGVDTSYLVESILSTSNPLGSYTDFQVPIPIGANLGVKINLYYLRNNVGGDGFLYLKSSINLEQIILSAGGAGNTQSTNGNSIIYTENSTLSYKLTSSGGGSETLRINLNGYIDNRV
jgi:hypothetical protein